VLIPLKPVSCQRAGRAQPHRPGSGAVVAWALRYGLWLLKPRSDRLPG